MSLGLGFGDAVRKRRQIKPPECELRWTGCGDARRNDRRQRRHAADAGFKADRAFAVVGSGRRPWLGNVAMADDGVAAVYCFCRCLGCCLGRRLGRAKT
jgi:hypothetical protein